MGLYRSFSINPIVCRVTPTLSASSSCVICFCTLHNRTRFSELVNRCLAEGAQAVTRHGKVVVVVVSAEEYRRLTRTGGSLVDFLLSAPRVNLDVERVDEPDREVDL